MLVYFKTGGNKILFEGKIKSRLLIIFCFVVGQGFVGHNNFAFADAAVGTATNGGSQGTRATTQAPGDNKYNQAKQEQGAAGGASGVNAAIGQGLMRAGSAILAATCPEGCNPAGFVLLAMGGVAMMQGGHDGAQSAGAGVVGDYAYACPECGGAVGDYKLDSSLDPSKNPFFKQDPKQKVPYGPYGTIGEIQQALLKGGAVMEEKGMKVNPDGSVGFKDGTTVTPAQMQAAASSGQGLDMATGKKVKDLLAMGKKYAKDAEAYKVSSMGLDSSGGGGGGGGGASFTPYESKFDMSKYLKGLNKKRGPASVVGKTKIVAGEPIGVAGDNIFKMIQRRYEAKTRTNSFLSGGGGSRRPSSYGRATTSSGLRKGKRRKGKHPNF